jgi:hypothetical protein
MTSRILPFDGIGSPANSFFAVGDHQNLRREVLPQPLTDADLRFALNYQLLFAERLFLIAEDLLTNERLMALLLGDYRLAIDEGLFVPMIRDRFDSIEDCGSYLEEADYYNQTGETIWRHNLRKLSRRPLTVGFFDESAAYGHFTEGAMRLLADPVLLQVSGIKVPPASLDAAITAVTRDAGRNTWRRSAMFRVADQMAKAGDQQQAAALRRLASVLYMAHFGGLFGQTSVFPRWYAPYIALLTSIPRQFAGEPDHRPLDVPLEIRQALPNTRAEDIGALTMGQILQLRSTSQFSSYIAALSVAEPSYASVDRVAVALAGHLEAIDDIVAERQSGAGAAPRQKRAALSLIRGSSMAGAVIGLADAAVGGLDPASGLVLAGSGLLFIAAERALGGNLREDEQQRREYWSAYCGTDGTFSAQVGGIRARLDQAV